MLAAASSGLLDCIRPTLGWRLSLMSGSAMQTNERFFWLHTKVESFGRASKPKVHLGFAASAEFRAAIRRTDPTMMASIASKSPMKGDTCASRLSISAHRPRLRYRGLTAEISSEFHCGARPLRRQVSGDFVSSSLLLWVISRHRPSGHCQSKLA